MRAAAPAPAELANGGGAEAAAEEQAAKRVRLVQCSGGSACVLTSQNVCLYVLAGRGAWVRGGVLGVFLALCSYVATLTQISTAAHDQLGCLPAQR